VDQLSNMNEQRDGEHSTMNSPPAGVAAHVMVMYFFADAIAAAIVQGNGVNNAGIAVFVFTVFASQAMMVTMWVGMGSAAILVRLLLGLAWSGWVVVLAIPPREWRLEFFAGAGLYLLSGAAPYGLLRVIGFGIVYRDELTDPVWPRRTSIVQCSQETKAEVLPGQSEYALPILLFESRHAVMQFSIVQMFCWTMLVGVMATFARVAAIGLDETIPLAIATAISRCLGLCTLWAMLGGQRVGGRIFAPFGLVLAITTVLVPLLGVPAGEMGSYIFWGLAITTATVAGVLGLFRGAGYRAGRVRFASRAG
jgi:hypothetical protein